MRESGVLFPIASLPTKYGIGGFSAEAYEYVNWLKKTGCHYWQILPLGPTGYGDSPYQSVSTFAGNPYFIDLEELIENELLTEEECEEADATENPNYIDYGKMYNTRLALLQKAYERSEHKNDSEYLAFCKKNAFWLDDYALFVAVKKSFDGKSWTDWDNDIKTRKPAAIKSYTAKYADDVDFYKWIQWQFFKQWNDLKEYANINGIKIIGDIPIYVAADSADAWANSKLFMFDKDCNPTKVAGCPPDAFSATGQLWGNPLYDWAVHKKTGYEWWIARVSHCFELYDCVRVDHFRGFDEFYAIPAKDKTAEHGSWMKGPGIDLFNTIKAKLGKLPIIAEDLGFLTDSVLKLLKDTKFPGMKVLQFAFYPYDPSVYLPHNHIENCVVYTGTHDNDTTKGWFSGLPEDHKQFIRDYLGNDDIDEENVAELMIKTALRSNANLAIIPMQDILNKGSEARLNAPSTLGTNWTWRMLEGELTDENAEWLAKVNRMYQRN